MKDVLENCDYYIELGVWPLEPRLEPQLWLENFEPDELPYAKELLASFFFFNEKMCKSILKGAFQKLSFVALKKNGPERQQEWEKFLSKIIFTAPDTQDNLTASGRQVCQWLRQVFNVPEAKFLSNAEALKCLYDGGAETVVFLDDFVGSGTQFTDTWTTPHNIKGKTLSFPTICTANIKAFYLPLVATSYGLGEIEKTCKNVTILPGNAIDERYSAIHPDSIIWSKALQPTARAFIEQVSKRAQIPEADWYGFHNLALTLAFCHSTPDAILRIFYWKEHGWKPLIEKH